MSRTVKLLIPASTAILALGVGTVTAAKAVNGKSLKNGSVSERKLSPAVRKKLNAAGLPGPQGPQGPPGPQGAQGPPGTAAPAVGSAVAHTTSIAPLALAATATILTLETPPGDGSGLLTVTVPSRLMVTGQVNAFKTTANAAKFARVHCELLHEDTGGLDEFGTRVMVSMGAIDGSRAVPVSLSLVGSVEVDPGAHDIGVRCEASNIGSDAGVSFESASVNVVAVPL